ncbi:MAG: hypothetical protein Q7J98_09225 [Kiritimatiellia bacterium]|nr:hypothetical protein [Kiritimatiellia bacterium]
MNLKIKRELHVVLLISAMVGFGLSGPGFCADYTQHEDFGVKKPGDVVSFTATPPGTVLSGGVNSPGGFVWVGGPASWTGTIPDDFAGVHNGSFSGTYQPPGEGPGPAKIYTWEADTKAEVVKLETETEATIPVDRKRKKLGVGEKVTLTLVGASGSVTWSLIGEGSVVSTSGNSATFTAYERGVGAVVIATYKGKHFTAAFPVVEPASISAVKLSEYEYPPGVQGTGMKMELTINPTDVSFNQVKIREVSGPATEVWGYFTQFSPEDLYHHAKPWRRINALNKWTDDVECRRTGPWYPGGYKYVIPIEWQAPEGTYIGRLPDNAVQTVSISDTNGTTTITKFGLLVIRTP